MRRPTIVQFNLSPTLGGAEVYTAFFSRALATRGWSTRLVVNGAAPFWDDLDFGGVPRVLVDTPAALLAPGDIAVVHAPLPVATLAALDRHFLVGVAHQAVYDGTRPAYYDRADLLLAVSAHVAATLQRYGLHRVHPTPLYGVADLQRGPSAGAPVAGRLFDVDAHKPRDRVVAGWYWLRATLAGPRRFTRRPGLTLGVVSRLASVKQFPVLFAILAPILARYPDVNLEIFGSAVGYKSLVATRSALAPIASRVRFWGHQRNAASAYRAIDYLLTGLPEREALGLNVLESCAAGTPVIAVAAPPFSETMHNGVTGYLYVDPRHDAGADFERVLEGILAGTLKPDFASVPAHLAGFSFARFAERLDGVARDLTTRAELALGTA